MFISKRKLKSLEERLSALEKVEKERRDKEQWRKEHGDENIEKARELLFGR